MQITIRFLLFTIVIFLYSLSPRVYAAEVTFRVVPNTVANDTATIVEAYIDPKGEELNAVEGTLYIERAEEVGISSIIVETGDSELTLWPTPPSYSFTDHAIRFTGGKPEGFHENGLLFRMRVFSKKTGIVTLSWIGGLAYRNDGLGSASGVSSRSLSLTLSYGEPNLINASSHDTEAPQFDTILISQDPEVYDGKYFLSFHASDDLSGVARYTVVENQITTEVHEGTYVLLDQDRKSRVVITAYDNAGNSTSIKAPEKYAFIVRLLFGIVAILIAGLLCLYSMRRRTIWRRR
jgi:hypothetical protein